MYGIFSGFNLKWGNKVGSDAKDLGLNKNNFSSETSEKHSEGLTM